jgi:S1-C subfamily serine protease
MQAQLRSPLLPLVAPIEMIQATVEIDQSLGDGRRVVGAGFLVQAPTPQGAPRVVLVTAAHVLAAMPGPDLRVGWRFADASGQWRFQPQPVAIREAGRPRWAGAEDADVAALVIDAPPEFARAAIPLSWLAGAAADLRAAPGPGEEMFALGYPEGLAANSAGFPILRAGHVASYPPAGSAQFTTFLLDLEVYEGNSGGPVFDADGGGDPRVEGLVTRHRAAEGVDLRLAEVAPAAAIRRAIAQLDAAPSPPKP